MTPGLWIALACSASIFTALSWARLCHWAKERPYSDGRQLPAIPEWANETDERPLSFTVATDGRLKEVWL